MAEQELDLRLNKTTKLVLRGVAGRSTLLEIRRAVNNPRFGHGWLVESQAYLDCEHIRVLHRYLFPLVQPPEQTSGEEPRP